MFRFTPENPPEFMGDAFRKYTDIGGYPIFYITTKDECLCPDCATEQYKEEPNSIAGGEINWEDSELYCEKCSDRIESAYAEE